MRPLPEGAVTTAAAPSEKRETTSVPFVRRDSSNSTRLTTGARENVTSERLAFQFVQATVKSSLV